ncbi:MAG: glutathione S-transferase family protein [Sphingomonadaceae bacterium]
MAEKIIFYTNPMSRGRIVRWMLEELGERYETVMLDYGTSMKSSDYLAINPMGKVPAIVHGGTVVTEAAAICAYLADAFPARNLAPPPGNRERGPYYRWLFFAAGPVEAAVTNRSLGLVSDRKQMIGYGSYEDMVDALEHAVRPGPYVCGERFTAADVYVGSQIGWGLMFETLPARPAFKSYFERLSARDAYARASALDDEAMAARQTDCEDENCPANDEEVQARAR